MLPRSVREESLVAVRFGERLTAQRLDRPGYITFGPPSPLAEPNIQHVRSTWTIRVDVVSQRVTSGATVPFSWKGSCVQLGATVAYNAPAAADVKGRIKTSLQTRQSAEVTTLTREPSSEYDTGSGS